MLDFKMNNSVYSVKLQNQLRMVYIVLALFICCYGNLMVRAENATDQSSISDTKESTTSPEPSEVFGLVNVTKTLDSLLEHANPRVRPGVGGPPVDVFCSFYITTFGSISDEKMEYTMDIYLRQRWADKRLIFSEKNKPIVIPSRLIEAVWVPDLYFPNEKKASFHTVTVPNRAMRVFPNGTVIYSVRITLTLSCPMVLSHFPMDTQLCFFVIESYGHEQHDLQLKWSDDYEFEDDLVLPQFDLIDITRINCSRSLSTGNFPCLKIQFRLQRQFGFYLLQTYIPSILIVIISWVSFWINMDAVPARITLGVTTVLTMVTQLSGSRANLPKVSYPKAMDVWVAACMFFVFAALIEYAFVNVLGRRRTRQSIYRKGVVVNFDEDKDENGDEDDHQEENQSKLQQWKRYMQGRQAAVYLDKASRIIFPASFLTFNAFYWIIYMTPRWMSKNAD